METKTAESSAPFDNRYNFTAKNSISGYLFGLGFVAFFDEAVFHQLLHWHHFYDKSTTSIGLISDGLFHAFSWFATIGGLFLFSDLRRRKAFWSARWWGGVLLGAGVFQFFDGTIQHKVWRIHQIRYVENVYIYDWIWNITAAIMIFAGIMITAHTKRKAKAAKHA